MLYSVDSSLRTSSGFALYMLQNKILLQHTVFVAVYFFLIYLFIYSNIAMKCSLCFCMVAYTLDMHIRSLCSFDFFTLKGHGQGQSQGH